MTLKEKLKETLDLLKAKGIPLPGGRPQRVLLLSKSYGVYKALDLDGVVDGLDGDVSRIFVGRLLPYANAAATDSVTVTANLHLSDSLAHDTKVLVDSSSILRLHVASGFSSSGNFAFDGYVIPVEIFI